MKRKKFGQILSVTVTVLLLLLLVFCTFFGDAVYQRITPKLSVEKAKTGNKNGVEYTVVSKEAVTENSELFYLTSEAGFSRTIYRIYRKKVVYEQDELFENVLVKTELPHRCLVVVEPEKAQKLKDGTKVLPEK